MTIKNNCLMLVIVCGFLVSGCATPITPTPISTVAIDYTVSLIQVQRPQATKDRWGDVETVSLVEGNKYSYEDNLFNIFFVVVSDRISFLIRNKTDHSLKIIWNESAYIDLDGSSSRIMHEGIKYSERNSANFPPTIVPSNGMIEDFIVPVNRVWYQEGYYGTYRSIPSEWKHLDLISLESTTVQGEPTSLLVRQKSTELEDKAKLIASQRFGVLLPIEIEGVVNEYTFWFKVTEYQVNVHSLYSTRP